MRIDIEGRETRERSLARKSSGQHRPQAPTSRCPNLRVRFDSSYDSCSRNSEKEPARFLNKFERRSHPPWVPAIPVTPDATSPAKAASGDEKQKFLSRKFEFKLRSSKSRLLLTIKKDHSNARDASNKPAGSKKAFFLSSSFGRNTSLDSVDHNPMGESPPTKPQTGLYSLCSLSKATSPPGPTLRQRQSSHTSIEQLTVKPKATSTSNTDALAANCPLARVPGRPDLPQRRNDARNKIDRSSGHMFFVKRQRVAD